MAFRSAIQYIVATLFSVLIALLYQFVAGAEFLPALMIGVGLTTLGALMGRGKVITWTATLALAITFFILLALVFVM